MIIAHGDVVQDFTVRPWVFSSLMVLGIVFSILYLSATTYLVFRDEIIDFSRSEQAQMQTAYEDRIADLRSQLDRVASRQMVDQQEIENRVQMLMRKQADYEAYSSALAPIFQKAKAAGVKIRTNIDIPTPRAAPWREKKANTQKSAALSNQNAASRIKGSFKELASLGFRSSQSIGEETSNNKRFQIASSLQLDLIEPEPLAPATKDLTGTDKGIDTNPTGAIATEHPALMQLANATQKLDTEMQDNTVILGNILKDIRKRTARVERRIAAIGVKIGTPASEAMGGPYLPLAYHGNQEKFSENAEKVAYALDLYMKLKENVRRLPIAHPLPSGRLTSRFGPRRDPFMGRMAMHSGIDIAQARGTPIRAAGEGKVTHAGRRAGYGLMVEIDHGNGVTSRYAHMSRVSTKKGRYISKGTVVGKVGSSGRSTGPHLHFETRIRGKAVNPNSFLLAGNDLRGEI
ncbi:MAG: M23 family metallopeptidase [Cohaesibacter sp.]|nr:M23 family metallopeptidase [Cohaesibacter sp.]